MRVSQLLEACISDNEIKKYIREDIVDCPLDEKAFEGGFLELFRWLRLKFQFHTEVVISAMALSFMIAASALGRKSSLDKNIKSICWLYVLVVKVFEFSHGNATVGLKMVSTVKLL